MTGAARWIFYRTIEIVLLVVFVFCVLAALAVIAHADEPFRLEPRAAQPVKPVERIEPIAMPAELLPKPPVKPSMLAFVTAGCQTCKFLERDIEAGKLSEFDVEVIAQKSGDVPGYVRWFPCVLFTAADGTDRVYPDQRQTTPPTFDVAEIPLRWHKHNPGKQLDARLDAAAGRGIVDQLVMYAGTEGTIVFTPSKPIKAKLDDGTVLAYSRVAGKYSIVNGVPSIVFDPPLIRFDGSKLGFIHFGGGLEWVKYEAPETLQLGTSIGRYRIKMEEAK